MVSVLESNRLPRLEDAGGNKILLCTVARDGAKEEAVPK